MITKARTNGTHTSLALTHDNIGSN